MCEEKFSQRNVTLCNCRSSPHYTNMGSYNIPFTLQKVETFLASHSLKKLLLNTCNMLTILLDHGNKEIKDSFKGGKM